MGIGVSVFLIALGAILAFATSATISGLDLTVVGYILIAAGVIGLVLFMLVWGPRRRTTAVDRTVQRPVTGRRTVVQDEPVVERRVYDDPL